MANFWLGRKYKYVNFVILNKIETVRLRANYIEFDTGGKWLPR